MRRDDAEGWKYVAIDESNHGKFPEILVAALSNTDSHVAERSRHAFPKLRKYHQGLDKKLANKGIDYSFLLYTLADYEADRDKMFGIIVGSLLVGFDFRSPINVYIDGELRNPRKEYVERALMAVTGFRICNIAIHSGADLDKRVELVNAADEIAHSLYKKTLEKGAVHPKKRNLRRDFI